MFRLFWKLLALLLVLALAGPFFIKGPAGEPLIGLDSLGDDIAVHWSRFLTKVRDDSDPLPLYRWQDTEGNWHYSDSANPDGDSELFYVNPDDNVVPFDDVRNAPESPDAKNVPDANMMPGSIGALVDDARDARQSMDERNAEIEKRTDEER